ncbi:MAG: type I-U CRISPR-associated protein Cas8c [Candidatus Eisenbacteria bacterium]|nr:type I-U CRISPR-associated protein Cas8c [Candidatus Eisenbacteria bacterium]
MSEQPEAAIRVRVDPTNPGQFFACCGLLELADRLWGGAEGWFEGDRFVIRADEGCSLPVLLDRLKTSLIDTADGDIAEDAEDDEAEGDSNAQPLDLVLPDPLPLLRLDWWTDKSLKPWAGSMNVRVIYRAMASALDTSCADPLNDGRVVFDPVPDTKGKANNSKLKQGKKREPFYFDARRGASARSLDIGFAPDALKGMTTVAFPAVESLCLVGLQRFRPMPTSTWRVFDYHTWAVPLEARIAPTAVCGLLPHVGSCGFRFENAFRTDQRKHKAFLPATPFARS